MTRWLQAPAGRYVLEWEQRHLDQAVVDLFGFHALQLGMVELEALRANRMPHRWVAIASSQVAHGQAALDVAPAAPIASSASTGAAGVPIETVREPAVAVALHCEFDALPFASQSLDLLVLPHALELARDPHLALREVERVLVPEGRVVIVGFNPASLWGLRQRLGRVRRHLWRRRDRVLFLPSEGEFIGYRRLRDWLRLLSFEVEAGRFGCYLPPVRTEKWLARFGWMERTGDRWWPVFGAVYFVVAVKRVRGMRLVGLLREQRVAPAAAPAPARAARKQKEMEPMMEQHSA